MISKHESDLARRKGLLAVGLIDGKVKEVWRLDKRAREIWNLEADPLEVENLAAETEPSGAALRGWMDVVSLGLSELDSQPVQPLDEASAQQLKDLGYVD